ncbi:MAG: SDR family oxidoreductase [Chloroflexi bacterium]|nr:SDR family oxidoreductase [Chloroflexota bacterium]
MTERVVVITGATGALGQLATQTFAARGDSLVLLSRNQNELDSLARDLNLPSNRLLARAIDLLDAPSLRTTAEAVKANFGRVHALIHLVGGWTGGKTISETAVDDFASMLNQHAWTTFHLFQAFVPQLIANGWGRVITVSLPLTIHPQPKMSAHAAGKAAQEALVLTLAEETRGTGVTANILHVNSIDAKGKGKGTSPKEIVAKMEYLCSEEASDVTGMRLAIYK